MMGKIRLPKGTWSYDTKKPLGSPGGFGAVFRGEDSKGNPVAVKRLHIDAAEAAHRELTIAKDLAARNLQMGWIIQSACGSYHPVASRPP
jgi:serine/threonine protein kinase